MVSAVSVSAVSVSAVSVLAINAGIGSSISIGLKCGIGTSLVLTVKLPGWKLLCQTEHWVVLVQDRLTVSPGKSTC